MFTFKPSDTSIVVIDPSGRNHSTVRKALAQYKTRWNESLADKIGISSDPKEAIGSTIIIPEFMSYQINALNYKKVITIDVIQNITMYELRRAVIVPVVHSFSDITEFISVVEERNPSIVACDFETASKWTSVQKAQFKEQLEIHEPDTEDYIWLQQQIKSDGLSHPSLVRITHLSVAVSETESFVITISLESEVAICEWLCETEIKQVWHNASFDFKHVYFRTQNVPKLFEDSELLAKCYLNHTQNHLAKTGLKELAKSVYGNWGDGVKDSFSLEHMHDERLIHYAGIDTQATLFVWNEFSTLDEVGDIVGFDQLFPIIEPRLHAETPRYFYENALKPMVPHSIRLMYNGINLDQEKASKLEDVLVKILDDVATQLEESPTIKAFREFRYTELSEKKKKEIIAKKRDVRYYLKEYKHTDLVMRSFVVNTYLEDVRANYEFFPDKLLPNKDVAWAVNDLKKFIKNNLDLPMLQEIVDKTIPTDNEWVHRAMIRLAQYKSENYNVTYETQIDEIDMSIVPRFNPGSTTQMQALFNFLEVEPLAFTDTGAPSWGREQLEELVDTSDNPEIVEVCKPLVTYSQSSIIKTTFIEGFKKYVVDGVLYGNFRLFGTKTARPTSKQINLLNLPSTGSVYAKPVKECLKPFDGDILYTVDLSALEDRVIATISKDKSKCAVFTDGLDGHSLNCCGYFREEVEALTGPFTDDVERVKAFMKLVDEGNKEAKALRQRSKGPTFALAYGAYPKKIASQVKCTIDEAQSIFDRYHNVLYGGITDYRENYVLPTAIANGKLHMLLGAHIKSADPEKDIRTLNNSTVQSFSLITLVTMCRINELIDEAGYQNDIRIMASIYDSLYYSVTPDPTIIKWLNDIIIPIMTQPYIVDEAIHNEAEGEVGDSFSNLIPIPNNCSIEYIKGVLDDINT